MKKVSIILIILILSFLGTAKAQKVGQSPRANAILIKMFEEFPTWSREF